MDHDRTVLIRSDDLSVTLDFGHFLLLPGIMDSDEFIRSSSRALDQAGGPGGRQGVGIGQEGRIALVRTPVQWAFDMPLRVELWNRVPDNDLDEWPEAFELHVDVGPDGLCYESPTHGTDDLGVPAGSYRVHVSGRRFLAGRAGARPTGGEWRVRLWSDGEAVRPRRLSAWSAT